MDNQSYKLRYLPLSYKDLEEKVTYIVDKLQKQQTANAYKGQDREVTI